MNTMVSCNRARRLIDEADHPELLSFEASSHVASCADCGSFAEHRARLRSLLTSGSRVSVPMNFDAVLKTRLANAKRRWAFGWLNPTGYLRLGAATAGLVIMVIAAQYGGLFSSDQSTFQRVEVAGDSNPALSPPAQPRPSQPGLIQGGPMPVVATGGGNSSYRPIRGVRESARTAGAGVPLEIPGEDYHLDGGVMLVRGPNGEGDVSLPMVSVGAQSLVYASAGASPRTVRTIGTSF
jgi:hypothetical protein